MTKFIDKEGAVIHSFNDGSDSIYGIVAPKIRRTPKKDLAIPYTCPDCGGKGNFPTVSDCCGEYRDGDTGLCYCCHDHCGAMPCDSCGGTGFFCHLKTHLHQYYLDAI